MQVADRVRNFLADITTHGGSPRNLATGLLLAGIVESIVTDAKRVHHVCGYHALYGCYLTWPFRIGRTGVSEPINVNLPPHAESDLTELLKKQR